MCYFEHLDYVQCKQHEKFSWHKLLKKYKISPQGQNDKFANIDFLQDHQIVSLKS